MKRNFSDSNLDELRESLKNIDQLEDSGSPILIYLAVTDPKKFKKIKTWEEAQLSRDEVVIGAKVFDCYMVDAALLKKDDPILEKIGKPRAPGFFTFHGGKFLYKADGMPRAGAIYSCLKKSVKKVYGASLDKVVRAVKGVRKDLDRLASKKVLVQQKLSRLKENDRSRKKVLAEMEALLEQEKVLQNKEKAFLDLQADKKKLSKK